MRTGRDTGVSEPSESLTLKNLFSFGNVYALKMGIPSAKPVLVTDPEVEAVPWVDTELHDFAVGAGNHGHAGRSGNVESLVQVPLVCHRMHVRTELHGYPAEA